LNLRSALAVPSFFVLHVDRHPRPAPQDRERPLRLDDRDRRRLVLVSALTVASLPAVWLVNREDDQSLRPNVAAVGAAVGDGAGSTTLVTIDPMGDVSPQFLNEPAASVAPTVPGPVAPVIGTGDGQVVGGGRAIFRRSVRDDKTCLYSGVPSGSHIVVVNAANDRSVDCWTAPRAIGEPADEVVMSAAAFAAIADPTAAPIHVDIRLR
jgi:hypothetical protein